MLIIHLLSAIAGALTIMAQILPVPSNITIANNAIPGANLTSSKKAVSKTVKTSGRCGIHVIQNDGPSSSIGITLRSVDWNGVVQYEGSCPGTVCAWPLLGMGEFLISVQVVGTSDINFYRQGTVSRDSWSNTDPEPRCKLGAWSGNSRQFDCGYACGELKLAT